MSATPATIAIDSPMFRLIILAAVAALFWSSTPARNVTADALSTIEQALRP